MKQPIIAFLTQLLLAIRSRFTRRAQLEAENLLLLAQIIVLRRRRPRLRRRPATFGCWWSIGVTVLADKNLTH
jgi:hypothetical protein